MIKPVTSYLNEEVEQLYKQLKSLSKQKICINKTCKNKLDELGHDIINTILDNMVLSNSPVYIKDLNNEKIQ